MSDLAIEIPVEDMVMLRGREWPGEDIGALLLHEPRPDCDLDRWLPLIPFLLGDCARVVAIDLRGHGASDGEFAENQAPADIAASITWMRAGGSRSVVVIAAGESARHAIAAAPMGEASGIIALSPSGTGDAVPRGAGIPKLLIAGARDEQSKAALSAFRAASIGPAMAVHIPTDQQGSELIAGEWAPTCREHILAFIRERRIDLSSGRTARPSPDSYLEHLGLKRKEFGT